MIPIYDDNPTERPALVMGAIIGLCVVVQLVIGAVEPATQMVLYQALGFIPSTLVVPEGIYVDWSLLTNMFLHAGWWHLIGNMAFLWVFGDNVEDAMGHGRFIVFYLLCGLAATLGHAALHPLSDLPLVGASGAISGVLGAYVLLTPHARILLLTQVGTYAVSAKWFLGLWFGFQVLMAAGPEDEAGGIAFLAHAAGFLAGMVLVRPFVRDGVALFRPASETGAKAPPKGAVAGWLYKRVVKAAKEVLEPEQTPVSRPATHRRTKPSQEPAGKAVDYKGVRITANRDGTFSVMGRTYKSVDSARAYVDLMRRSRGGP